VEPESHENERQTYRSLHCRSSNRIEHDNLPRNLGRVHVTTESNKIKIRGVNDQFNCKKNSNRVSFYAEAVNSNSQKSRGNYDEAN